MRMTRLRKYRRQRYKKAGLLILKAIVLPVVSVLAGYLITMSVVLPTFARR